LATSKIVRRIHSAIDRSSFFAHVCHAAASSRETEMTIFTSRTVEATARG
jgi:hypothetical protein